MRQGIAMTLLSLTMCAVIVFTANQPLLESAKICRLVSLTSRIAQVTVKICRMVCLTSQIVQATIKKICWMVSLSSQIAQATEAIK